jgi:hypothetical protein
MLLLDRADPGLSAVSTTRSPDRFAKSRDIWIGGTDVDRVTRIRALLTLG